MRTVVALYDNFSSANAAVRELVDRGFNREDISLMASDVENRYSPYLENRSITPATADATGAGAGIGAIIGGLGGLLVGLGALAIPGIGPVIAAGPLATALSGLIGAGVGAVAGGVTGGLIGALVDLGVPEQQAGYYAEGVRRGGTLVVVQTSDDMADDARNILDRHYPVDVNERVGMWQESGWTGYNQGTEPYTANEINNERRRYYTEEYDFEPEFADYDEDFRNHYESTYYNRGYGYDYYLPAYYYGYSLASDQDLAGRSWAEIEPEARAEWEQDQDNEGTWDEVKDAVQHAWQEAKDVVE